MNPITLVKVRLPAASGIPRGEPGGLDDADPADGVMRRNLRETLLGVLRDADLYGSAVVIAD